MHVHLPKPLHGWRAFAGEVGIIVIGVLIALGAEQFMESRHWHEQLGRERAALQTEVQSNLDAVKERMVMEPCVHARLAELEEIVPRGAEGNPVALAAPVGLPVPSSGSKGAWSIALSGEALAHMPLDEQLAYSNAFANYENWDSIRKDERDAWIRLDVLDQHGRLGEPDWAALRQALSQAMADDVRVRAVGPFIFANANVGVKPEAIARERLFAMEGYGGDLCRSILPPSATAKQD